MSPLATLVQAPWAQALGWTLLHFLWQGAALGLLAWLALALLRGASARARYGAACAALLLMIAAPVATFLVLQHQVVQAEPAGLPVEAAGALIAEAPLPLRLKAALDPWLPWLLGTWALGVALLSGRFLGGWARVQRLRHHGASPVPAEWHLVLSRLCRELRLSRTVRLLRSAAVDVPTALGWLRPVILLPACALSGLAPRQLEAILAHELAHIRRGDFLVNLLQSLVEVTLFYHPAVWWLSARIRHERELCCDDVAASLCGDPLLLARALTDLEALREAASPAPHLALAANGGSLMHRVRHLLQPALPASNAARAAALALVAASLLGAGVALQDQGKEAAPKAEQNTRMKVVDGDRKLDLQMKGDVQLDATAKEPVAVPGDGSFRVEEKLGGKTRAYSASKEKRTYTVDGQERPLDAEGEAWLREAVKDAAKAQKARDKVHRIEIRTRRMEDQTRELDTHLKELDTHLKDLDRLPELSPEERAKVRADLDKARADLEKARAERRKVRMEVIRKKGEAGKDVEILTEDVGPDTVIIRRRADGKDVVEKRVKLPRPGKGEAGTWVFAGPGEEDMVVEVPGDITIPPVHIPEIHIGHPGVEADPQVEIRALQSAMKSMQKRLDQLQKQMAATPKGRKTPKGAPVPPRPPVSPAPPTPPAPPAPPDGPGD
ncbi:M56 family metallopeptidase [Geothrix fermentans]|uniref:M56 family metallopeptidase n=1 Tax=Geothrix fermentans TaxID=44676 RepID=UPI0003FF5713|nr:M56 family metallopeptidase [Geothrix fermentans]